MKADGKGIELFSLISLGCLGSCHTKAVFRVMRSDEVESRQLFTANNGVGTVLLDICPYLYIASPLCTFLTLIRQNKFYSNTLRKWAWKFTLRQRVFVSITGRKSFFLNLHVHLHVALVISHHRSYCLAKENPLLADNALCFWTYLCSRCLAVQLSSKCPPHLAPSFSL